jgi:hypothetical protein
MKKIWIGETILLNATPSGPNGNWWTKKRMKPETSDFFLKNLSVFSPLKNLPIKDFRNLISGLDEGNLSKAATRGGRSIDIVLLKDLLISKNIVNIEPKKEDLNIPADFAVETKSESDWSPFNTISVAQLRKMLEPVPGHFQIFHINEIKVDLMNDELIIKLK